jgi:hypothetical protein
MNPLGMNQSSAHATKTIEHMRDGYRAIFEKGVKENAYMRSSPWTVLNGIHAADEILIWQSCLIRANYKVYNATVWECICRWRGGIYFDKAEHLSEQFYDADCILIRDLMFYREAHKALSDHDRYILLDFLKAQRNDGTCIICPANDKDKSSGYDGFGPAVEKFIERSFEVINADQDQTRPQTRRIVAPGIGKHGRASTTGLHSKGQRNINTTRD